MNSTHRRFGPARTSRTTRVVASLALGTAVALGAAGCTFITPQATTIQYSPGDGVNVPGPDAPVQVRNALIVADDSGREGNFVAALVNTTAESQTVHIEFGEGLGRESVRVPAGATISLGADAPPLLISGLNTPPGADLPVAFQSGDSDTVAVAVAVLDGALPYLEPLVPTEGPSSSPSPTPTPSN